MCCTISIKLREDYSRLDSCDDTSKCDVGNVSRDHIKTNDLEHVSYVTSKFHLVDLAGSEMVSVMIKHKNTWAILIQYSLNTGASD